MPTVAEKMIASYPPESQSFVFDTSKEEAIRFLKGLANTIEEMEPFDRFPEGAQGVVLYALLKDLAWSCPDIGDFNYVRQGCHQVLDAAFGVLAEMFH